MGAETVYLLGSAASASGGGRGSRGPSFGQRMMAKAHTHILHGSRFLSLFLSNANARAVGRTGILAKQHWQPPFIRRIVMAGMRRCTFDTDNEDGDASR